MIDICSVKNCEKFVQFWDLEGGKGYCYSHANSSDFGVQVNLRHVETGDPYLDPDYGFDEVEYDRDQDVGPQHWPPPFGEDMVDPLDYFPNGLSGYRI